MTETKQYKDTVNLPQTKFDMRANAIKREPELQKFWAEEKIYEYLSQENPGEIFILHDGPPYANGTLHIGHALNKILKDFINRYMLLQGRKVRYVPGWDCHGLPIELKVLQDMKPDQRAKLTPIKLRQKAREFALKTVKEQSKDFQRYGVWGDWENPYLTLKPEYEAAQIAVFGNMFLKGYIYRGRKPVNWSPSSKTALAEAELEYPEDNEGRPTHVSRSLYVAFLMTALSKKARILKPYLSKLGVAIWTTTPWTIPANLAISVNPELNYAVVETDTENYLLVATDLVDKLSETLGTKLTIKVTIQGKDLEHCKYRHPLFNRESEIVIGGDYVTTDSGTGLVHTAPGHGLEDYAVGLRYNLPVLSPVDADGKFTEEAGQFAGLNVLNDGNDAVVKALEECGALLKEEAYRHKYPYDWRTKKPTIFRATEQWFASVEGFREEALKAIKDVNWIPAQGENRITSMVADRSDWCISRQRSWGVPIPVFYDEETGEPLINEETINHVQAIIAEKGSDAWWQMTAEELLPESYQKNGRKYIKGTDTMDVWFDSGSSWAAVAHQREELRYPADMYLEGSDQHRGWFQSSLLTSVSNNGYAPYKTVLTHGFVLDEQGRKMSKSIGNVVDPKIVIEGGKNKDQEPAYGADVLRLWVASVDYSSDVPIGKNILKQMSDVYRKIRNTAKFLLGNLHDFNPDVYAVPYEDLPDLDKYLLHRMTEVFGEVKTAYENYEFDRVFQLIQNFCTIDLSNFYLDIAKDRLYISDTKDILRRRTCQTVMAIALENLAKSIAPILCHLAEDIWQYIPYPTPYKSVFQAGWVHLEEKWHNPELAKTWLQLRQIRGEVNKVLEQARMQKAIGSSLEAKVLLYVPEQELHSLLVNLNPKPTVKNPPVLTPIEVNNTTTNVLTEESTKEDFWVDKEEVITDTTVVEVIPVVEVEVETLVTPTEIVSANIWIEYGKQSQKILAKVYNQISSIVEETLAKNQNSLLEDAINAASILAVVISSYVAISLLKYINQIILLPDLFKIIGFGYSIWFIYRYLVKANSRQELYQTINTIKEEFIGITPDKPANQANNSVKTETETVIEKVTPPVIEKVTEKETFTETVTETVTATKTIIEETPPVAIEAELPVTAGNQVDELRYLFLASQVEILDSPEALESQQFTSKSDNITIAVVNADGEKCDRCWNYSDYVGKSSTHPLLCERCIPVIETTEAQPIS